MASKLNLQTIFSAVDKLSGPSKTMGRNVSASTKSMTAGFKLIGGAIAGIGIGAFAKKSLDLASDLVEVQNVVDTSFGPEGSKAVNKWSKDAIKAFGLSELQAKQFNGTMGAMLKSSGLTGSAIVSMSTKLSGLAGDFASFYNLDAEDAFTKIRSGISGETEPLKQLGINMSVANLEAFALSKGIKKAWKEMSQAEQVELRYNYLLKASTDVQGDFAKTLETSYANQKRVLKTQVEQAAARAMSSALPYALKFAKVLNTITENVGSWIENNKGLIDQKIDGAINLITSAAKLLTDGWNSGMIPAVLAGVAAYKVLTVTLIALPGIIAAVNTATFALQAVMGGAATVGEALNLVLAANPAGLVCIAISALVGLTVLMIKHWSTLGPILGKVGLTIVKALLAPINWLNDALISLFTLASKLHGIGGAMGKAADFLKGSGAKMNKMFTGREGEADFAGIWASDKESRVSSSASSPVSSNTTTTNRSQLDVNFNSLPAGSSTRQTGYAPGITVNTGRQMVGGAR